MIVLGTAALFLPLMQDPRDTGRFLFWGLPSLMIVAGAVSFEARGRVGRLGPLMLLGDASFSIYLFHPFILKTVMTLLQHQPAAVRSAAVMLVAAAVGVAVFRYLERPMTVRLNAMQPGLLRRPVGTLR